MSPLASGNSLGNDSNFPRPMTGTYLKHCVSLHRVHIPKEINIAGHPSQQNCSLNLGKLLATIFFYIHKRGGFPTTCATEWQRLSPNRNSCTVTEGVRVILHGEPQKLAQRDIKASHLSRTQPHAQRLSEKPSAVWVPIRLVEVWLHSSPTCRGPACRPAPSAAWRSSPPLPGAFSSQYAAPAGPHT